MAKHFDQYCPVAHALSLVGERWAFLIVRELLHGPRRYTDLADGLPGIATNVLAARLRDLEAAGVVRKRRLPPPAPATVYELTEYGAGLDEVFYALARWGARSLGPPGPDDELYPEWGLNAFPALFAPEAARGLTETYVLRIEDYVFTVHVEDGCLRSSVGAVEEPDLDAEMDMTTFFRLAERELEPAEALRRGLASIEGKPETFARCFEVLSLAPRASAAA
ncbi:MAG TPA: helix-turn-helix domain-containing protein [Gaiellaceae bacterium]|nr:helix-turn-helix domain-containing protein [Gaiellaceae bacterium]